jgi:hypothetical protein
MSDEIDRQEVARPRILDLSHSVFVRILVMASLLVVWGWRETIHLPSLLDGEIWQHLRTGGWILQHSAVPRTGLFSQHSDLPWIVPEWGFDLALGVGYKFLGLRAIPVLILCVKVILALVVFLLAGGLRNHFWYAVLLSCIGQYLLFNMPPSSVLLSVLFYGIELTLLLWSRRSGSARSLLWLPPLFACWANFDIQFAYGLLVLGLFLAAVLIERLCRNYGISWDGGPKQSLSLTSVSTMSAASLIASVLSPYTYHPFRAFLQSSVGPASLSHLKELHSMSFRQPQHYVLLLLVMAAFLVLGARRSRDVFKIALMVFCTPFAFHRQGDAWFVVLPAIAIIADTLLWKQPANDTLTDARIWTMENLATAVLTILLLAVATARIPRSDGDLLARARGTFPIQAANFIKRNNLPRPMFNTYEWGGFLIWYLPDYPVSIDGRNDLYGSDRNDLYFMVTSGSQPLDTDADFMKARTILLARNSGIGSALSKMPGFKVVYSDDLAIVLQPEP